MYCTVFQKIRNCNWLSVIRNDWYRRAESAQYLIQLNLSHSTNSKHELPEKVIDFDGCQITPKAHQKLVSKLPLVKEFFLGRVDTEIIPYPEVIARDDMMKLCEEIQDIQKFFEQTLNTTNIENVRDVSAQTIENLKNLGCFGLNIPKNYGKGYLISESLIASESELISSDLSSLLISHRVVADVINEFGNDAQKRKYLPQLAEGSLIASTAIYEGALVENQLFNTKAEFDDMTEKWILKGEKANVINGEKANLFLVIAQTDKLEISGIPGIGVTLFLVDGSLPGLKRSEESKSFGLCTPNTCNLSFDNISLSPDNIIGQAGEGNKPAQVLLKFSRLRSSLQIFGLMKQIVRYMTDFCINNKQLDLSLQEMDLNKKRLSEAIYSAYAVESMIYYTAGLMDEFEKPDVDVECAITKLFSLEKLWKIVKSSLEFLGPASLSSGQIPGIILQDAAQLYAFGETVDSLYSYIGLSGLQYAGLTIYEDVKKQRNPLFHPGHVFSKFFKTSSVETPNLNLNLEHYLHPSLSLPAKWLEVSIGRLKICTDILFTRYGSDVIQKQIDIKRLSKMVTLIYAMFTSLSRSSRSYCIGLQLSDHELLLVTSFCLQSRDIIKNLALDIEHGEFLNNDRNYKRLSKQIFKSRGYFSEHPLKYNF